MRPRALTSVESSLGKVSSLVEKNINCASRSDLNPLDVLFPCGMLSCAYTGFHFHLPCDWRLHGVALLICLNTAGP